MPFSTADVNSFIGIVLQQDKGAPAVGGPGPAKMRYAKYLSGTAFGANIEVVPLREGGDGLQWGFTYKKSQKVAGQIVANLRPEIAGALLSSIPAGATWDGGSAPAGHTFHTGHASFPYSTIIAQFPATNAHVISDARFTGFTIEGNAGEPWKITLPFTAISHGASLAAAFFVPTYILEDPFMYQYNPTYVVDGAGASGFSSFKIAGGYGIEELQANAVTLDELVVQNADFDVEYTKRFEDITLWRKIAMGAGVTPTTSVATGSLRADSLYGSGAGLRSLRLDCPLLAYTGHDLGELDPDGKTIIESVTAKALKAATHNFIAVLKNSHASAYTSST